jgi:hypothetical protein
MKKMPKIRSTQTLAMHQHCKAGPMRDRRDRRPKDAKRSWKREEF